MIKRTWSTAHIPAAIVIISLTAACQPIPPRMADTASPPPAATPTPEISQPAAAPASGDPVDPMIIPTVLAAGTPTHISSNTSPDGRWRADVDHYPCTPVGEDTFAYDRLTLTAAADESVRIADSQLISCGGLGAAGLEGKFWSANSLYFYYTTSKEGVPDGCGYWGGTLTRLEISTMSLRLVDSPVISPDKTRIASWDRGGHALLVWDAAGGEPARADAQAGLDVGPVAWAPGGGALVYIQNKTYCGPSDQSVVVQVNLPDLTQTVLLRSQEFFQAVIWDSPDQLQLMDSSGKYRPYQISTGELGPAA